MRAVPGLRLLSGRVGLTGELSRALARRSFTAVHDRGRALVGVAVMLADGGGTIADTGVLRHPVQVLGPMTPPPTVWRALDELTPARLRTIEQARARVRRYVWSRFPEGLPASMVRGAALARSWWCWMRTPRS